MSKKSERACKGTFSKDTIEKLYSFGLTDQQLADVLEVNVRTIHRWKKSDDEFLEAATNGKEQANDLVQLSLFKCAVGYSKKETKVFHYHGKIVKTEIDVFYPPNGRDALNWLRIRRPDEWGEPRQKAEDTIPEIGEVTVYINGSKSNLL